MVLVVVFAREIYLFGMFEFVVYEGKVVFIVERSGDEMYYFVKCDVVLDYDGWFV